MKTFTKLQIWLWFFFRSSAYLQHMHFYCWGSTSHTYILTITHTTVIYQPLNNNRINPTSLPFPPLNHNCDQFIRCPCNQEKATRSKNTLILTTPYPPMNGNSSTRPKNENVEKANLVTHHPSITVSRSTIDSKPLISNTKTMKRSQLNHLPHIPQNLPYIYIWSGGLKQMVDNLSKVIEDETYQCKILSNDTIKVSTQHPDTSRIYIRHLHG